MYPMIFPHYIRVSYHHSGWLYSSYTTIKCHQTIQNPSKKTVQRYSRDFPIVFPWYVPLHAAPWPTQLRSSESSKVPEVVTGDAWTGWSSPCVLLHHLGLYVLYILYNVYITRDIYIYIRVYIYMYIYTCICIPKIQKGWFFSRRFDSQRPKMAVPQNHPFLVGFSIIK